MLPAKLRPLHGLCASLLLAGVSFPLPGSVRAEPSQPSLTKLIPAKDPRNGSGHLGDVAVSGNLGSLEPNVAAGMEANLQARGEKQPRPL